MGLNAKIAIEVEDGKVLLSVDGGEIRHNGDVCANPLPDNADSVVANERGEPGQFVRSRICGSVGEAALWVAGCRFDSGIGRYSVLRHKLAVAQEIGLV